MLLPAGELNARDGRRWRLDDAEEVVEASRLRAGATDLVFDYGHQADYAKENGQPAPAAGWIRELQARAGAIWGGVEWTERARAMLKARGVPLREPDVPANARRRRDRGGPRRADQQPRAGPAGAGRHGGSHLMLYRKTTATSPSA